MLQSIKYICGNHFSIAILFNSYVDCSLSYNAGLNKTVNFALDLVCEFIVSQPADTSSVGRFHEWHLFISLLLFSIILQFLLAVNMPFMFIIFFTTC